MSTSVLVFTNSNKQAYQCIGGTKHFRIYVHRLPWHDPDVIGGHQYKPCPTDSEDRRQRPRCFLLGACSYQVPGALFRCQVSSALSQGEKESYSVMTNESP